MLQAIDAELKDEKNVYEALEQYLTGLEEQLRQLQQMAQRISDRRLKLYDFVKTLGPIFSSLGQDDSR